jgi:hypothetical protein
MTPRLFHFPFPEPCCTAYSALARSLLRGPWSMYDYITTSPQVRINSTPQTFLSVLPNYFHFRLRSCPTLPVVHLLSNPVSLGWDRGRGRLTEAGIRILVPYLLAPFQRK